MRDFESRYDKVWTCAILRLWSVVEVDRTDSARTLPSSSGYCYFVFFSVAFAKRNSLLFIFSFSLEVYHFQTTMYSSGLVHTSIPVRWSRSVSSNHQLGHLPVAHLLLPISRRELNVTGTFSHLFGYPR